MSSQIIFYGAGEEAGNKLHKWKQAGLIPVCFADADKRKHYTRFADVNGVADYDILPLNEAIERYSDYLLYLTLGHEKLRSVIDALIEYGIPEERIRYADPVEWRKGCPVLGKQISLHTDSITTCISWAFNQRIPMTNTFADDFSEYKKYCNGMITDLRDGVTTTCEGCIHLREAFWDIEPEINAVDIGGKAYCNFNCIYCNFGSLTPKNDEIQNKKYNYIMSLMQYLRHNYDVSTLRFYYASGELSAALYCDVLVDFWRENNMNVTIVSNASVYRQSISRLLRNCNTALVTSLDAGTRETFKAVHRTDCFDTVVDNLKNYADNDAGITLKYIILEGINDNYDDINGFIDIAAGIKAGVCLSSDFHKASATLRLETLGMMIYLLDQCKARGLFVSIERVHFHPIDAKHLDAELNKSQGC